MDLNKVAEYRNKIAATEKKEKKINEDKITLRAQIDQSTKLRDEKIQELSTLGVEYATCDTYIADKEKEIKDIETQIENILSGKDVVPDSVASTVEELPSDDLEFEDVNEMPTETKKQTDAEIFGDDMPF